MAGLSGVLTLLLCMLSINSWHLFNQQWQIFPILCAILSINFIIPNSDVQKLSMTLSKVSG